MEHLESSQDDSATIPYLVSRRMLFLESTALCALLLSTRAGAAQTTDTLAEDAAIWGLPLVLTGRYFSKALSLGYQVNHLYLNRTLADAEGMVPGYNVDTLYGFGWLDLNNDAIVLDVPETNGRYYSIQFMDAYANVFAYVGSRTTGTHPGTFLIAGPDWKGTVPPGAHLVRARTNMVLALVRTLVRGDDLAEAQSVQLNYQLSPLSTYPVGRRSGTVIDNVFKLFAPLSLEGDGKAFFTDLDQLVRRYPPRGPETDVFRRLRPLGLGQHFAAHPLPAKKLGDAFVKAMKRVKSFNFADAGNTVSNGWHVNYQITSFIADPLARASVNQLAPGAHTAQECLYFMLQTDASGNPLNGGNRYALRFPKGQLPPVDGFWSVTLYGADFMLAENKISRYAIGDRTSGLTFEEDGSLCIALQHEQPDDSANWLPTPTGDFILLMRTYLPQASLLDRQYQPPPAVRL